MWIVVASLLSTASSSPATVEDGVYSRVTVQIEPQPQPENCVEFLNQLEVRRRRERNKENGNKLLSRIQGCQMVHIFSNQKSQLWVTF
jgi:7,8-dihydro-6-hydroxymethylpterin-pyrophosphokinase